MRYGLALLVVPALSLWMLAGCEHQHQEAQIQGNDPESRDIAKTIVDMRANDPNVRIAAATHLGDIKADREGARDALESGVKDTDARVRKASAESLRKIGSFDALNKLKEQGNAGRQEARDAYNASVKELRDKAAKGDSGARDTLKKLGEKDI